MSAESGEVFMIMIYHGFLVIIKYLGNDRNPCGKGDLQNEQFLPNTAMNGIHICTRAKIWYLLKKAIAVGHRETGPPSAKKRRKFCRYHFMAAGLQAMMQGTEEFAENGYFWGRRQ